MINLSDLRRFAKKHPEVRNQTRLVMVAARAARDYPRSKPVQNLLRAQCRILHQQMLELTKR